MSVPCVGAIQLWCAAFCVLPSIDICRNLGALPLDASDDTVTLSSVEDVASTAATADAPVAACQESAFTSSSTRKILSTLGTALCEHAMFVELAESYAVNHQAFGEGA